VKIIPGPASRELGEKLANELHAEITPVFLKSFPDGESYIRFEKQNLKGEDAVIVQTTSPPQDQRLLQLMLMADNAKDLEARSITAIVPYFAYSRQDKRFILGEAFSIKTIIKLLENCGVTKIISLNAHNPAVLKNFNVPVLDLSAIPLLAEYFKARKLVQNPLSLSMGKKALSVAQEADNILHGGYDYVASKRDVVTGNVTLEDKSLPVKNRDVIIFDDIIQRRPKSLRSLRPPDTDGRFIQTHHRERSRRSSRHRRRPKPSKQGFYRPAPVQSSRLKEQQCGKPFLLPVRRTPRPPRF
jgi:ribose-phosphate pyrophosphokinase